MGGGLGAVGGAEGVVHVDITERRHFLRERVAVLFFADIDAAVFQQHHIAPRHVDTVQPIGDQWYRATQQLAHPFCYRRERIFGFERALGGAAQMRGHHHRRAIFQRELNCRHRGANAGVVGDVAGVVLRHVQVGADEDALVPDVEIG